MRSLLYSDINKLKTFVYCVNFVYENELRLKREYSITLLLTCGLLMFTSVIEMTVAVISSVYWLLFVFVLIGQIYCTAFSDHVCVIRNHVLVLAVSGAASNVSVVGL